MAILRMDEATKTQSKSETKTRLRIDYQYLTRRPINNRLRIEMCLFEEKKKKSNETSRKKPTMERTVVAAGGGPGGVQGRGPWRILERRQFRD